MEERRTNRPDQSIQRIEIPIRLVELVPMHPHIRSQRQCPRHHPRRPEVLRQFERLLSVEIGRFRRASDEVEGGDSEG